MPDAAVLELGDRIAALSPADARDLRLHLKESLGILAPGGDAPPPAPKVEEAPVAVQTEFDVILGDTPPAAKIAVIKAVREITGLALADAKNYVEKPATKLLKEQVDKKTAEEVAAKVVAAGGKATLK